MDVVNFLLVTVIIVTVTWFSSPILAATLKPSPALMLAESWQPDQDIAGYTMSEKFDGVRAYWDGEHLLTRSGRIIEAPEWFTVRLPESCGLGLGVLTRLADLFARVFRTKHCGAR